jgi:hypothetical protein
MGWAGAVRGKVPRVYRVEEPRNTSNLLNWYR